MVNKGWREGQKADQVSTAILPWRVSVAVLRVVWRGSQREQVAPAVGRQHSRRGTGGTWVPSRWRTRAAGEKTRNTPCDRTASPSPRRRSTRGRTTSPRSRTADRSLCPRSPSERSRCPTPASSCKQHSALNSHCTNAPGLYRGAKKQEKKFPRVFQAFPEL